MKRTIYLKLLGSYIIFALLTFLVLAFFTQDQMTRNEQEAEATQLYREAIQIAANYSALVFDRSESSEMVQKQLETLSEYNDAQILLIDPHGNILMDSENPEIIQKAIEEEYTTIEDFSVTDFGNKAYMTGDFYGMYKQDHLIVYATANSSYHVIGYVVILRDLDDVTLSTNAYMNAVYYTAGFIILASFVILIFFTFVVYWPVRKITDIAGAFAQGDFTKRINLRSSDEIGYLAKTLDYMADELNSQEEDQRKFVSNVSHDFRSPLTSIKGYCEAMLDGTIPVEMQDRYLGIILSETERLNKLTQSLLDLNQFGRHELRLDMAEFDINRMIKNVLLTFEGICSQRKIVFDLVLTGEELFVKGDMVKIQQVLYNLVDNAIKFSHNDSKIKIETSTKKDKVFVSVKDYGIGIPQDSLKKVWERFYKTDASRGRDKRGIGLGLSIVKEIITAHKQNINVISTEGVGTEFIFSLAMAERSLEDEDEF